MTGGEEGKGTIETKGGKGSRLGNYSESRGGGMKSMKSKIHPKVSSHSPNNLVFSKDATHAVGGPPEQTVTP